MNLTQVTVLSGAVTTLVIVLVTVVRQRRFESADFFSFVITFISGSNIPPSLFLCFYAFNPDADTVQTKLHGYEKYIFLAGLALFLISLMTLWKLLRQAFKVTPKSQNLSDNVF